MRFDILTLFPDLFTSYLQQSLLKQALQRGLVEVHLWNIRDWATDRHRSVDAPPLWGWARNVNDVSPCVCLRGACASSSS